jgi:hypothetical protein
MTTWTFHHFNGFLNYTSVFTSRVYCWVSQTLQIINTYFIRCQSYCDTSYSRGSVNQMWILKLFTDMLGYIQPWPFSSCNSITILSSLPSTQLFPHSKLKDRLKELVQLCLIKNNCQRRYKYIVLARNTFYCVNKNNTDTTKTFFEVHRSVQTIIAFYVPLYRWYTFTK